jgi:hypothetical protein
MVLRWLLVLLPVAACSSPEESITFDHSEGTGNELSGCTCTYYDGTDNDWSIEISCNTGHGELEALTMFADPRNTMGEGDGKLIMIPQNNPANYVGGAAAIVAPIGADNHSSDTRVIRDLSNVSFRWADQIACNVAQPCEIDSYHLLPGSLSGGHGACEDYYATQQKILSN